MPFVVFEVHGEPAIETARAGVGVARDANVDMVVAVGGGSVIDLAKAVAMLLGNGGDPLDYLEVIGAGRPIEHPSVPMVALPTTAGTGSEVTSNAVLPRWKMVARRACEVLRCFPRLPSWTHSWR